jgi:hypothetical protein
VTAGMILQPVMCHFFLNISASHMWTLSRDNVITKTRLGIQNTKFVFTIIWNPSDLSVLDRFRTNTKMKSGSCVTNRFIPSKKWSFLEEGNQMKNICDSFGQLLTSHKSGFNRLTRRISHAPHATPTHTIH